jgi:hypothetical protein
VQETEGIEQGAEASQSTHRTSLDTLHRWRSLNVDILGFELVDGGSEMKRSIFLPATWALCGLVLATAASAQPALDGNAAVSDGYGAALSVQNTNTQFGNGILGDAVNGGGGSEIDQVFGVVSNGRLYVTVSGNLEKNFNKLEVFIDSKAGGVNSINGSALPAGVDAFCCGGIGTTDGALQRMDLLTFDAGFEADYFLTFTHGDETVNPGLPDARSFWAASAHYADLSNGTAGAVVAAGMQLAPRGLPNALRFPGDYNKNGIVDAADYVVWRDTEGQSVPRGTGADANGNEIVDDPDYAIWAHRLNDDTTLSGFPFIPNDLSYGVSEALISAEPFPGLAPGQLIDRAYAQGAGGCTGDTGADCIAPELEFALDVDPSEVGTNQSSHRNFNNTIDLQMAFDNSNTEGVSGDGPYETPTTGNPQDVTTGVEFSIPLEHIGNPTEPIRMTIFVNGGGHDFASNQFSGAGLLAGNVGSLMPNLEVEFPGIQYVTVPIAGAGGGLGPVNVPEPASAALLVVSLMGAAGLRRRDHRGSQGRA